MSMSSSFRKLRWIIGGALALLLLTGCGSVLRIGYGQGPTLAYWWLDGYFDVSAEQTPRLRDALDQWFEWHRRVELPLYANLLARAQREVMEPLTPQAMCAWRDEAQRRLDAGMEQAAPPLAALIVTLTPEQLRHMERKLAKTGAELRADYAQADRAERARESFKRTLEQYENLYGKLDESQRARLAQLLAASTFDADRWLAERDSRNADMMRTLASVAAAGDVTKAQAAVRVLAERALRSPRADYGGYQERLMQENCALVAAMHNLTTTAQRQYARNKLKGWEDDLRVLASAPANGGTAAAGNASR